MAEEQPDFLIACLREWPPSHALLRAIECRKLARHPLPSPVLDLGCGDGRLTRIVWKVLFVGVDRDPLEVRWARALGAHRALARADARALPFRDGSFASVFSNCALEHVDGLDAALAEVARVLRPGGTLLATIPLPRWESAGPFPALRRIGWHALSEGLNTVLRRLWHHVTLEERPRWEERLARVGLAAVAWEPYMVPDAYAAYARYLPISSLTYLTRALLRRQAISFRFRRALAPFLARRLRAAYLAEGEAGACALFRAVRSA